MTTGTSPMATGTSPQICIKYVNESCLVPGCFSSTIRTPDKRFLTVPRRQDMRSVWCKAMGRVKMGSALTKLYICEDHFDIQNDCVNIIQHNLTGCRLKLKDGVVPHKFECQELANCLEERRVREIKEAKQVIINTPSPNRIRRMKSPAIDMEENGIIQPNEENKLPFKRFAPYFFLKDCNVLATTLRVICTLCPPVRMLTTCRGSSSNLLRHLRKFHPEIIPKLPPAWSWRKNQTSTPYTPIQERMITTGQGNNSIGLGNDSPETSMAVSSILSESSIIQPTELMRVDDFSTSFRLEQLVANFIINGLHPVQLVERCEFQNLITGLKPGAVIMDKVRLGTIISDNANSVRQQLRSILSDISHVCLSTDGWRVFDKYFLGVSVHWIDPSTFERRSAVLCCRRLCGPHSLPDILLLLSELEREFCIEGKVVQVTTDNGLNFTKPCRIFGSDAKDEEEIEIPERDYEYVELYPIINGGRHTVSTQNMPPFERCMVHTMDLVASEDTRQAEEDPLYRDAMREALFRCQNLWRAQGCSLENAEFVKANLGAPLEEPKENTWRSQYRALKHLRALFAEKMGALDKICDTFNIPKFREVDKVFVDEYCKVLRPVAAAMDTLLAESNAFTGVFLPVIHALSRRLTHFRDQASNQDLLVVCYPLLEAVIDSLSKRFESLMFRKDLVLAAVLHPEFQLNWLKDAEKESLATECLKEAVRECYEEGNPSENSDDEDEDDLFDFKRPAQKGAKEGKWHAEVEQYLSFSTGQMKTLNSYPLIKSLFLQYNTPLPATANTEKAFTSSGDIFTLRSGVLNDPYFEDMVIVKMGIS
ncbi:uncharacterized protein LOC129223233 [Uloborus diversus]|uniref:uncharacterized protein LOC129223233 n=1 Tax=Uloborus diversus TaxID=327109 RepID=UPI00240A89C3|nr:uncharacterized protein LOC129223233 [Uloborus diversus]